MSDLGRLRILLDANLRSLDKDVNLSRNEIVDYITQVMGGSSWSIHSFFLFFCNRNTVHDLEFVGYLCVK